MPLPAAEDPIERLAGPRLFAVSFIALFLELIVIRWVPSVIQVVAYFANLMLLSSFLGLGMGALISTRGFRLFRWFPLALALAVTIFVLCQRILLPGSSVELRFVSVSPKALNYLVLILIFLVNTLLFVPLGERVGQLFRALPALRAYTWDLGGSLSGTLAFGIFSFLAFSPLLGMAIVALLFLLVSIPRHRWWSAAVLASGMAALWLTTDRNAFWSPYHYITVHQSSAAGAPPTRSSPKNLRSMRDPPIYQVKINQSFYQLHGTIDGRRYSTGSEGARMAAMLRRQYRVPYVLKPRPRRVAVVGAGGGMDVEAAVLAGAESVSAVEIDPALVALSRRFNASGILEHPKVSVRVDDARTFFMQAERPYDLIVFGFLDSQALSSSMANIRLDGFVYTVESLRSAYARLAKDGMLALSFFIAGRPWLVHKLVNMAARATGRTPLVYFAASKLIICVSRTELLHPPERIGPFRRVTRLKPKDVPLATDDWPYLYLAAQTIPSDYLIVIGTLLLLSIGGLLLLRPKGDGLHSAHFLFLGAGFLLLQTKSIITCSLFFGATWLVTMLVVAGILLMVLAANTVAHRLSRPSLYHYLPLFVSLLVPYFVPNDAILSLSSLGRVLWIVLVIPLPVFFAGLIFSTTFRESKDPSASFGANLIGATIGGFAEYLGMALGYQQLSLLVIAAYAMSLLVMVRARRRALGDDA